MERDRRRQACWQDHIELNPVNTQLPTIDRPVDDRDDAADVMMFDDATPEYWSLDATVVEACGLDCTGAKLVIYRRNEVAKQFRFMRDNVLRDGRWGYILGSPGSGKSVTALAFALAVARAGWVVTWVHLWWDSSSPRCVRIEGNAMKITSLQHDEYLSDILDEIPLMTRHIVFVDGVTLANQVEARHCRGWLDFNRSVRRLVYVSSMASRMKAKLGDDTCSGVQEHFVSSWKFDEYLAALNNDELFRIVEPLLDASENGDDESLELLVQSKYYFGGGCARYVFAYPTARVVSSLDKAVEALHNFSTAASGTIGARSSLAINRLISRIDGEEGVMSQYAAVKCAARGGPELITRLASILNEDMNAAMDGWLFEMFFFACIRKEGVWVTDGTATFLLDQGRVNFFNPTDLTNLRSVGWLKPLKYNEGGYDAVYVDKEQALVRFVQVTKARSHSFRIEFFHAFLNNLCSSRASFEMRRLEILFVIPIEVLGEFSIAGITGQGLLEPFGWKKFEEVSKVKVVGMKSVDNWSAFERI